MGSLQHYRLCLCSQAVSSFFGLCPTLDPLPLHLRGSQRGSWAWWAPGVTVRPEIWTVSAAHGARVSPSQGGHRALGTAMPDCRGQRRRLTQASVSGALRPGRRWAGWLSGDALSELAEPGGGPARLHRAGSAQRPHPLPTSRPAARLCRVPSGRPRQALQASCSCAGHLSPFILPGSPQETPSHPLSPPRRHSGSVTPLPGHRPVQWAPWAGPLHLRGVLVGQGRAGPPLLEACTRLCGRRGRRDVTPSPTPRPRPARGTCWGGAGRGREVLPERDCKEGLGALEPQASPRLRLLQPALDTPDPVQKDRPCPRASRTVRLSLDLPGAWGP